MITRWTWNLETKLYLGYIIKHLVSIICVKIDTKNSLEQSRDRTF